MYGQDYMAPADAAALQDRVHQLERANDNLKRANSNMLHTLRLILAARRSGQEINWSNVEKMVRDQ